MSYVLLETEPGSPVHSRYPVSRVLYRGKSRYQKILVFESPFHGRMLALDNRLQLTTREEYFYHEALVHPAAQAHPGLRTALVIGGGDGGAVRELVKYPALERIIQAELDEEVVRVSRKYLPQLTSGFKDPRVELYFGDGYQFLRETEERFDLIVVDLTDPIGAAKALFEEPFYKLCAERLTARGLLSAQTESLHFDLPVVQKVYHALAAVFQRVEWVVVPLTMYAGNYWTISVASKKLDPLKARNPDNPETRYYLRANHKWYFMPAELRGRFLRAKPKSA